MNINSSHSGDDESMGEGRYRETSNRETSNVGKFWLSSATSFLLLISAVNVAADQPSALPEVDRFLENQCVDCHNAVDEVSDLNLEGLRSQDLLEIGGGSNDVLADLRIWEQVIRRLRGRQMPPPDYGRPDEAEYVQVLAILESILDRLAESNPHPGRTDTLRRLTRSEYQYSVRDLFNVPIDVAELLPADESSHGFDNVTVGELSPMLLSRYVTAAEKVGRLAKPFRGQPPIGFTLRIPPDLTQQWHVEGLPLGTRGGIQIEYYFPQSGKYRFQFRLARDRDGTIEGLNQEYQIDVLVNSVQKHRFDIRPPKGNKDYTGLDDHLSVDLEIPAGRHQIGVTFPNKSSSLLEIKRQPFDASYNRHRHPRPAPAIGEVSIYGPIGSSSDILLEEVATGEISTDTIRDQLRSLARRSYRRPVTDEDLAAPMRVFTEISKNSGVEVGYQAAVASILVNPNFLFKIEQDDPSALPGEAYQISDLELASRLSFFLWSSIPDEELLSLAEAKTLSTPAVLHQQVDRMLADPRSRSLVENFAAQWLYLRNIASLNPDLREFPDFDQNLKLAFRRETEMLFESVLREDMSVLRLIDADWTYLNERLALHYGIPGIRGGEFRRVQLSPDSHRGGILRHGSILLVTSYATRTSPTVRGNWVLENIIGTPPPPPPPNVPSLKEKNEIKVVSLRERLAMHRSDPACASCHNLMDPIGFSLDNFDAVGRWRILQDGAPIDSKGMLPDGSEVDGVQSLELAILKRPEMFVSTLTEKLMTFALGRGIEPTDAAAVRKIVRYSAGNDYQFSSLIHGIVFSQPFQMRSMQ